MLGKKKRRIWLPLAVLLTGTVVAALDARLAVRYYRLETARVSAPVRIALLTDLHSCDYGEGQAGLLEAVAAEQMNLFPDDVGLPLVIIDDGRLLERNLKLRGFNEGWLQKRLEEHNVHNVRDVFLLSVDEQNRVYFVPREVGKG